MPQSLDFNPAKFPLMSVDLGIEILANLQVLVDQKALDLAKDRGIDEVASLRILYDRKARKRREIIDHYFGDFGADLSNEL